MTDITYPIRINRYLYLTGVCSRRQADRYITAGQIFVNGKKAVLGQQIQEGDIVTLNPIAQEETRHRVYYAYHKPVGIVSHNPQKGEKSIEDVSDISEKVFPIGRLDKASRGLMLLSNDGRIVDALLNPKYEHEKEYIVTTQKSVTESFTRRMEKGVDIGGYITKPAKVSIVDRSAFHIILTEGKKHQIRRMCDTLGNHVKDLVRIRIAHIHLRNLKEGAVRPLTKKERAQLMKLAGL